MSATSCRAREVTASQGIMLETRPPTGSPCARPALSARPDKQPAARLETLRLAGELRVPFTTGIRSGSAETREERIEALEAIAASTGAHGHIQEVIVQNFRAKPGTKMAGHAEPSLDDLLWTAAVARLVAAGGRARAAPAEPVLRRLPPTPRRRHDTGAASRR